MHLLADRFPVTEGAGQVAAHCGIAALSVDRCAQIDPAPGRHVVGLLPRHAHRVDVAGQAGRRIRQRHHMSPHPRVDPRRARLYVFGLRGQPLHHVVAGFGGDRRQLVQSGPGPFGVDMVGRQR